MKVNSNGRVVNLAPGKEATMVDPLVKDPLYTVLSDGLARRGIEILQTDNSNIILLSDFSIIHAFSHQPLLAQLLDSHEKQDNKLVSMIEKSAASIKEAIDRQHGPYSVMPGTEERLAGKRNPHVH